MQDEFGTLSLFGDEPLDDGAEMAITEVVLAENVSHHSIVHEELQNTEGLLDITLNSECDGQLGFIDDDEWWKIEWQDMPEFVQEDIQPWKNLIVTFRSREDMLQFGELISQKLTNDTRSVWYPIMSRVSRIDMMYIDEADE